MNKLIFGFTISIILQVILNYGFNTIKPIPDWNKFVETNRINNSNYSLQYQEIIIKRNNSILNYSIILALILFIFSVLFFKSTLAKGILLGSLFNILQLYNYWSYFLNIIENFAVILVWYPFFIMPIFIGFSIIIMFKQDFKFNKYHYLELILPWLTWILLLGVNDNGKSLANVFEAILLGFFIVTLLLLEVLSNKFEFKYKLNSKISLIISCIIAINLWAFIPLIPE